MTEQEIVKQLETMNHAELVKLAAALLINEENLRNELDKIKGIIR